MHGLERIAGRTGFRPAMSRRSLLYCATAVVGAAGLAAAAWPFIAQMNPDAGTRAAADVVDLDLADLGPAQQRVVPWRGVPIFVARRTAAMLDAMHDTSFESRLIDPRSEKRQQPASARNWHRSVDPAVAVLVGVCTYCACVPRYLAEAFEPGVTGGYVCPCCASHYDPAGRAYAGAAQYNLPVPPHRIIGPSRVVVGQNMPGEIFSLESIERM